MLGADGAFDFIVEHCLVQPIVAVGNYFAAVEFSKLSRVVGALEGGVREGRCEQRPEERPDVGLVPKVIFLEEASPAHTRTERSKSVHLS